jgi:hypothetical protein
MLFTNLDERLGLLCSGRQQKSVIVASEATITAFALALGINFAKENAFWCENLKKYNNFLIMITAVSRVSI